MINVVGSGCDFWAGDGGGAGANAGDCDRAGDSGRDGLVIDDAVMELSDERLDDSEGSTGIGRTTMLDLGQHEKCPYASRGPVFMFIIDFPCVLCKATTRCYARTGQNLTGAGTLTLGNWDSKLGTLN